MDNMCQGSCLCFYGNLNALVLTNVTATNQLDWDIFNEDM